MRSRVDQFIPALGGLVCLLALPGIATAQTDECTDASAATLGEIAAEDILQGTASSTTVCDTGCHATTNEAPVAAADSYATDQDVPLSVPAPGVLGNDTDGDGDSLTASLVSGATNGALTLNPDGSFSYTPNAGFSGSDSFSYLAADGTADSGPATVTLTINDVNDLPVAAAQNLSVTQNNPENIVLSYDDADGPGPYTFTVVSGPTNGVLGSDDGDASLTYTPNTGYTGPDSFTFRVNDGIDDSAVPAAVNVDVVAATPVVLLLDHFDRPDSTIVGNGWTELESPGTGIGIQGNRLVFLATNDATNRPMVTNTFPRAVSGQLFWDFEFDWSRTGSEGTYRLFMQLGDSSLMDPNSWDAGVGINLIWSRLASHEQLGYRLNGAQTPLAQISGTTSVRVEVDIYQATYRVLVDGVEVGSYIPMDGVLTLDTIRLFTDSLSDPNFSGRAFDAVEISAIGGGDPRNRIPVAEGQAVSLWEDTTLDIELGVDDRDGPGPHVFTVSSGPAHGVLGSDDGDAMLTYSPDSGYNGPDSFTFRVNDGIDDSADGTVSLTVGGPLSRLRGYTEFFAGGFTTNDTILAKPEGVVEGDLMIAVMTHGENGAVITPPPGWSLVRDDTVMGELMFPIFQKTAGPSEPDTYTFDISKSRHPVAALLAFRGGAINDHGGANSATQSTTQVAPSINAAADDLLLYVAAVRADATFSPPTGMTELTDAEETARSITTALELATISGQTGERSGDSSSDGVWAAALISITALIQ